MPADQTEAAVDVAGDEIAIGIVFGDHVGQAERIVEVLGANAPLDLGGPVAQRVVFVADAEHVIDPAQQAILIVVGVGRSARRPRP